jgi:peptide deformylase
VAIRDIVKYGDPRLLAKNADISDFADPELAGLVKDLMETCWAAPGYGLAAPQIGVNLRVAIVDLSVGQDPAKVIVLVNPRVVESEGAIRDEEGCLSLPDLVDVLERPASVVVEAHDAHGALRRVEGSELLARALCHEIDHLDSHVYIDRLSSLKRGLLLRKVQKRQRQGTW